MLPIQHLSYSTLSLEEFVNTLLPIQHLSYSTLHLKRQNLSFWIYCGFSQNANCKQKIASNGYNSIDTCKYNNIDAK
jgi:hypothetical protein